MKGRTEKSLYNSKIAFLYYTINLILGFFSRKIFIEYIGANVLGLNTTVQNLLGFLNLAELGIGSAVAFTLYKPISNNNTKEISEIIAIQGWLYRKIAIIIIFCATILMFFFPLIFKNLGLPLWYAYASFLIYIYSAILTYYINYRQILYSANQEEYKITYYYKSIILFQSVFQIIAISTFSHGYFWWLFLHFFFSTISSLLLDYKIKKDYPYLKEYSMDGGGLSKKYPMILTKVKQVFVHKIAGFVLQQTSPLIIYGYTSVLMVAIYGNYMLIITSLHQLFSSVFNSTTAAVGNLVASSEKEKILDVFGELFSSRFYFASICCCSTYLLINDFIRLWIGDNFILSNDIVLIFVLILYINVMRTAIDAFISAYGLYKDIYAPIIEASTNLILSIYLGSIYGIKGVVSGVLISLLLVVFLWKPYFVFRSAFKVSINRYIKLYLIHLTGFVLSYLLLITILNMLDFKVTSFGDWILYAILVVSVLSLSLFFALYSLSYYFRLFVKRMMNRYKNR